MWATSLGNQADLHGDLRQNKRKNTTQSAKVRNSRAFTPTCCPSFSTLTWAGGKRIFPPWTSHFLFSKKWSFYIIHRISCYNLYFNLPLHPPIHISFLFSLSLSHTHTQCLYLEIIRIICSPHRISCLILSVQHSGFSLHLLQYLVADYWHIITLAIVRP